MRCLAFVAASLIACSACGAAPARVGSGDSTSSDTCATGLAGLLTASQIGADFSQTSEGSSPALGLWNNGDAAYPDFKQMSDRRFIWNGLLSGTARAEVLQAWSDLKYSGSPPSDFLPSSGPLFSSYPSQLFLVAESRADFGAVSDAQRWMAFQRQNNAVNGDPTTRNGVEANPNVQQIDDDTFEFQITHGTTGDVFTDVEARLGSVIYAVSLDTGPTYPASANAASFASQLSAQVQSTCGAP